SRVIDRVDEQTLVEMARAMTASQLARTISSVRAVDGTRLGQDAVRQARWQHREDGMLEVRAVLPAEMGAEVVTALELALDSDRTGEDRHLVIVELNADTLTAHPLTAARADSVPAGTPTPAIPPTDDPDTGSDTTAEPVSAPARVPAGTPTPATPPTDDPDTGSDTTAEPTTKPARVPVGTSQRCGILGAGPLETRTAERLACNGKIALKVT